jgi:predicted nucleic acid-binding protein
LLVLDTSGLLAALDGAQRFHTAAREALSDHDGALLLSPFVLAELDYLLSTRVGIGAEVALLGEVGRGTYRLEPFSEDDVAEVAGVIERYADLGVGLADASNVVLANRHGTVDILTLDERHFRVLRGPRDRPFRLLPVDAG